MNFHDFFKGLNEEGIDYLVTGGVALNLHGVPRMTYDVDLVVNLAEENVRKAVRQLFAWGYGSAAAADAFLMADPGHRRRWIDEGKRALKLRHPEGDVAEVDLALHATAPFDRLKERAAEIRLHGVAVPVISLADLAAAKESMGRPEDRKDLESLEILAAVIKSDEAAFLNDPRREQIEKFRHWPVENRCEWLQTGSQLRRQNEADVTAGSRSARGGGGSNAGRSPVSATPIFPETGLLLAGFFQRK